MFFSQRFVFITRTARVMKIAPYPTRAAYQCGYRSIIPNSALCTHSRKTLLDALYLYILQVIRLRGLHMVKSAKVKNSDTITFSSFLEFLPKNLANSKHLKVFEKFLQSGKKLYFLGSQDKRVNFSENSLIYHP